MSLADTRIGMGNPENLKNMLAAGLITKEEYDAKVSKVKAKKKEKQKSLYQTITDFMTGNEEKKKEN